MALLANVLLGQRAVKAADKTPPQGLHPSRHTFLVWLLIYALFAYAYVRSVGDDVTCPLPLALTLSWVCNALWLYFSSCGWSLAATLVLFLYFGLSASALHGLLGQEGCKPMVTLTCSKPR